MTLLIITILKKIVLHIQVKNMVTIVVLTKLVIIQSIK